MKKIDTDDEKGKAWLRQTVGDSWDKVIAPTSGPAARTVCTAEARGQGKLWDKLIPKGADSESWARKVLDEYVTWTM